jgi:hypothetical protein
MQLREEAERVRQYQGRYQEQSRGLVERKREWIGKWRLKAQDQAKDLEAARQELLRLDRAFEALLLQGQGQGQDPLPAPTVALALVSRLLDLTQQPQHADLVQVRKVRRHEGARNVAEPSLLIGGSTEVQAAAEAVEKREQRSKSVSENRELVEALCRVVEAMAQAGDQAVQVQTAKLEHAQRTAMKAAEDRLRKVRHRAWAVYRTSSHEMEGFP